MSKIYLLNSIFTLILNSRLFVCTTVYIWIPNVQQIFFRVEIFKYAFFENNTVTILPWIKTWIVFFFYQKYSPVHFNFSNLFRDTENRVLKFGIPKYNLKLSLTKWNYIIFKYPGIALQRSNMVPYIRRNKISLSILSNHFI